MNALGLLVRHSLRANRRAILGLALIVALAGGLSLTTLAAARRTASAFPRYLDASDASDIGVGLFPESEAVTPQSFLADTDPILAAAREIPGVEKDASHLGLNTMYLGDDGRASANTPETIGSLDGRYTQTDRVALQAGRLPDPDRVDEVLVNPDATELYGMRLGSTHELVITEGDDEVEDPAQAEVVDSVRVRVVGIGRLPEEVLRDEYDAAGLLLTSPALTRRYLDGGGLPYRFHALHLTTSADPAEVVDAYEELSGEDYGLIVRRTDEQRDAAQRALRPINVALIAFGLFTGAAVLAIGGLGAVRLAAAAGGDAGSLRALGLSRASTALVVGAPAVLASGLGVAAAAALAVALSPLTPVGPVREVEPDPGIDLDATIVLGGGALLAAVIALVALGGAILNVRRQGAAQQHARPSLLGSAIASLGLSPEGAVGAREALGVGAARSGAAVRPTLAACTASVMAVVATLTFGASIDGLLRTPERYGWAADRALVAGAGYFAISEDAHQALRDQPDVRSVAVATYAPIRLGGRNVSAMGVEAATGRTAVTVLEGRLPTSEDEVAVGTNTARELDVGVGDDVEDGSRGARVVGIVALPAIGLAGVSHPSMAQGAVLTPDGLVARNGAAFAAVAFVDFEPGVDHSAAARDARDALSTALVGGPSGELVQVFEALKPAELVEVDPAKATALGLAATLGLAAVVALAFTLSTSVRRRRRQLAILATLGFDQRALRRSVRWQTGCLAGLALVIGVPLGVITGRLSWVAFAGQIGVAPTAVVPLPLVGVVAGAIVMLAVAVGEHPARAASRTSPAVTLRTAA